MKNATAFLFVFCCVKSLATAPESERGKKRGEYLKEVFAVCIFSGVEVKGCLGVKIEKLEIMKRFYKFNEYICSLEPRHKAQFNSF